MGLAVENTYKKQKYTTMYIIESSIISEKNDLKFLPLLLSIFNFDSSRLQFI